METYRFQKISYPYEGKLTLKEALKIKNKKEKVTLYIVDDFIRNEMVRIQFMKHYVRLLKKLQFYLARDDDTGVAYQEALNEMERFRRMIQNKKRFLLEKELFRMEKELRFYEEQAKYKLMMLNNLVYTREIDNRRSK